MVKSVVIEESEWCPAGIIEHYEKDGVQDGHHYDFRIVCYIMVHVYNKYYIWLHKAIN